MKKEIFKTPKPWSDDPVFQTTYFCNVHREDDKVTRWIRNYYSPFVDHPNFLYNIILARFINWPDTLEEIGFKELHAPLEILTSIRNRQDAGFKIWGSAYIVSTNGAAMPKPQYVVDHVLGALAGTVYGAGPGHPLYGVPPTLAACHGALVRFNGLGSFMAAQVVADLKNTRGHPLEDAKDWYDWCAPGPGSLRGIQWALGRKVSPSAFLEEAHALREKVMPTLHPLVLERGLCMQDFQNCLCEFDKYMRVKTGTGFSKRNYNGN